jgi:3-hydroxyisobutyrate dehydrogenase
MEARRMTERIAFIGLGNMGLPMAANLVKAGFDVAGFDVADEARAAAGGRGIAAAQSISEAVTGRSIIVTMLTEGKIVQKVLAEIANAAPAGALIVDCSTIDMESARKGHDAMQRHGLRMVDAPVSGGTAGAAAASLTFMCGGEPEAVEAARPVLSAMGKRIVPCGPAGSGQAAKICNNMILGVSMIAVCEAFNLADRIGLDRKAMFDVVSTSSGSCWSMNSYCPVPGVGPASPADNGYKAGFAAALMLKDLNLSQDAAEAANVATPLGAHARAVYAQFVGSGGGSRDFSAIIEALGAMQREHST